MALPREWDLFDSVITMLDSDKPVNRRRFFREGLRELLKPLANAIEPLHEAARQLEQMEALGTPGGAAASNRTSPRSIPLNLPLRPPGALEEKLFLDTCSRGGECVRVCPAQCIKIDPIGVRGNGAPYIDADEMPCVVCDGLHCMNVCPTGALVPTVVAEIDMGIAVWHADTCLRTRATETSATDRACTLCVEKCPIGSFAIELSADANHIVVKESGCIGCGVCQFECPTSPKSIVVIPRSIRK